MASKNKIGSISTKHMQIKKASSQTFAAVAVASVIASMSLVLINILWGTAQYNIKVQDEQEKVRDVLIANLEVVPDLESSFRNLEIGSDLLEKQPAGKSNSEVILDALPSRYDFIELAASIDNLAKEASVNLDSFRGTDLGSDTIQSSPNPTPQSIAFSMEVEGSYAAMSKFLRGIETSIRPIKVNSLSISGTDDKLKASISAETSYQPAFDLDVQTKVVQP